MPKRSKPRSNFPFADLFGPPPVLPGEDPKAYREMYDRVRDTIGPRDFVEEIWVRDLADVAWALCRWRRIKEAYLAALVSEKAERQASGLPSELSAAVYPHGENMDFIQADVVRGQLYFIQPIESLIAAAQRRIDEIDRELHRHRFMQIQLRGMPSAEEVKGKNGGRKMIEATATADDAKAA